MTATETPWTHTRVLTLNCRCSSLNPHRELTLSCQCSSLNPHRELTLDRLCSSTHSPQHIHAGFSKWSPCTLVALTLKLRQEHSPTISPQSGSSLDTSCLYTPSVARLVGDEVVTAEDVGQVEPLGFTSMITSLKTSENVNLLLRSYNYLTELQLTNIHSISIFFSYSFFFVFL